MKTHILKSVYMVLVMLTLALGAIRTAHADSPPAEVVAAAQNGLPVFLQAISTSNLSQYGFTNAQQLAQAKLGEPFQVFIMSPDNLKTYHAGTRLAGLLTPTTMWYFPVVAEGEPCTILTVDLMQGKWQAVGIGGVTLPKNIDAAKKALPSLAGAKSNEPYSTKFVRVPQVYGEFLAVEFASADYLMPIMTRPQTLALENMKMYTVDEIVSQVRPAAEKNIQLDKDATNATFGGGGAPKQSEPSSYVYIAVLLGVILVGGLALVMSKRNR